MNAPLPRSRVSYEWRVEEVDLESDDINDGYSFDTAADAVARFREQPPEGCRHDLVLVRDYGNWAEGVIDRQWAYVGEDGQLPETFDSGAKVTEAHRRSLAKAWG